MKIESGIDIVEIARIEEALKNPKFLQKTLTETEREYVKKKTGRLGDSEVFPVATVAGIFAAKEAVSKAIGVGLLKGIGFFDIEIDHTPLGAPFVRLSAKARKIAGEGEFSVSIAHDGGFAIAVANRVF